MNEYIVLIEKYNQTGEGIAFINLKPVYIFGSIIGEKIKIKIIEDKNKYFIGEIVEIITPSLNRRNITIPNQKDIGGYELIHMNQNEQISFKISKIKEAFQQIANYYIEKIDFIASKNEFYYRNKITLHNGFFHKKNTNEPIEINDYKLSKIEPKTSLNGEIIIRELENRIEGNSNQKLFNYDKMLGFNFRININSFYQVNKEITEKIYKEILQEVISGGITIDLYSGIATIAIIVANKSKKVVSVENNSFAHKDAIFNAQKNNINNITFVKEDVLKFLANNQIEADTLIVDPSRSGLNKKICEYILNNVKPKKIIYLSCKPATQARDFNFFKNQYTLKKILFFDMFPQTNHCETLMILEKN
ncbi:MAG: class I SAM-dependent RNA methyltransferase [Metamycoplasmataceae bacterium]